MLCAEDFRYQCTELDDARSVGFDTFCPQYHSQDRVAVVSPRLEDGVVATGCALLAFVTTFYDGLRARTKTFYDYPQHFALVGGDAHGVCTRQGRRSLSHDDIGLPWSHLDVWPESQWQQAPATVSGMLQAVGNLHINRLFWPEPFRPQTSDQGLPWYVQGLLQARLKSVVYYDAASPNMTIHVAPHVAEIVKESCRRLATLTEVSAPPVGRLAPEDPSYPYVEPYRRVEVGEFLTTMAPCFEAHPG
jgi:hypothetical protein